MPKIRVLLMVVTLLVISFLGYFAVMYTKGYRLDIKTLRLVQRGILVVKTDPSGAQVYANGNLIGASDSNFTLSPGVYDIDIKKAGFITWSKRLTIDKDAVTEVNTDLFTSTPSFSPITFSGVINPVPSKNFSQIAYAASDDGLWVLENINFPIGFSKDPRKVTDGNLTQGGMWQYSPDNKNILLDTQAGSFLLDSGSFTPQTQRVNIASKRLDTLTSWDSETQKKLSVEFRNLPQDLIDVLQRKTSSITFSPDQDKILYTASASGTLNPNLIKPFPGASTQKEERSIEMYHTYVYDIREDRNFLIESNLDPKTQTLFWLPNSRNLVLGEPNKITVMDYDGTNRKTVFSGNYVAPYVFPYNNGDKLLILTNLGADSQTPNLYTITIK